MHLTSRTQRTGFKTSHIQRYPNLKDDEIHLAKLERTHQSRRNPSLSLETNGRLFCHGLCKAGKLCNPCYNLEFLKVLLEHSRVPILSSHPRSSCLRCPSTALLFCWVFNSVSASRFTHGLTRAPCPLPIQNLSFSVNSGCLWFTLSSASLAESPFRLGLHSSPAAEISGKRSQPEQ